MCPVCIADMMFQWTWAGATVGVPQRAWKTLPHASCKRSRPRLPGPHKAVSPGQATNELHLTVDPSPCKYESGSTLGLQLPKLHWDMSLAIYCHGSKGMRSSKPALNRAFPKTLIKTFKLMASPKAARTASSSPLHAPFMCNVTLIGSPWRAPCYARVRNRRSLGK